MSIRTNSELEIEEANQSLITCNKTAAILPYDPYIQRQHSVGYS